MTSQGARRRLPQRSAPRGCVTAARERERARAPLAACAALEGAKRSGRRASAALAKRIELTAAHATLRNRCASSAAARDRAPARGAGAPLTHTHSASSLSPFESAPPPPPERAHTPRTSVARGRLHRASRTSGSRPAGLFARQNAAGPPRRPRPCLAGARTPTARAPARAALWRPGVLFRGGARGIAAARVGGGGVGEAGGEVRVEAKRSDARGRRRRTLRSRCTPSARGSGGGGRGSGSAAPSTSRGPRAP